jgi:hypothetical protein
MTSAEKESVYKKILDIEKGVKHQIESGSYSSGNLAGGSLGAVIFYFHLYKFTGEEKYLDEV